MNRFSEFEKKREAVVKDFMVFDAKPEPEFDHITELACLSFDAPIALISLIDNRRQWNLSMIGCQEREIPIEHALCAHTILQSDVTLIENLQSDARFQNNPLISGESAAQFYAGAPLLHDNGVAYGAFCILDRRNRVFTDKDKRQLKMYAKLVGGRLKERKRSLDLQVELAFAQMQIQQLPAAVVSCDEHGQLNTFNDLAKEWHQVDVKKLPPEQWAEHFDLYETNGRDLLKPESIPLKRAYDGEHIAGTEFIIKAKHLPARRVRCFGGPITDAWGNKKGAVVSMIDVTHHVNNQMFLETIINSASEVSIITCDSEGKITRFNSGAENLLGYEHHEVEHTANIVSLHDRDELQKYAQQMTKAKGQDISLFDALVFKANQGITDHQTCLYVCKDGTHKYVRLSITKLIDQNGFLTGYLAIGIDMSDQRLAEQNERIAAQRFKGAFNFVNVGMVLLSTRGELQAVNQAICDYFGYSQQEMLTKSLKEITHPDDLKKDTQLLGQLLSGHQQNYRVEKRYYRKNGELFHADLSVAMVTGDDGKPSHFVVMFKDITKQLESEQRRRVSETRLRGLFEYSPIGILMIKPDNGQCLSWNRNLLAPMGFSEQEFESKSLFDLLVPEQHAEFQNQIRALDNTNNFFSREAEFRKKQEGVYPVRIQGLLMDDPLEQTVLWLLVTDLTSERLHLELKNSFVSTVSHELRTPLTSITGALDLMESGALGEMPPELKEMLDIAQNNTQRLTYLVNDLLDLDKLMSGKLEIEFSSFALKPLLQRCVTDMRAYIEKYEVNIQIEAPDDLWVFADESRLAQVITNILSNACKHSPSDQPILLRARELKQGAAVISIVDHGPGIPKEFRKRIFERFSQAELTDSRKEQGSGLGLAISRELIEQMHGVIGFESEPGQGAHFWFRLPGESHYKMRKDKERLAILHVEDSKDFVELVAQYLKDIADVEGAHTLKDANEKIRDNDYDLVLLDLSLPDGHGTALWESIHRLNSNLPLAVISNYSIPEDMVDEVGAVISKRHFNQEKLVNTIIRLFPELDSIREHEKGGSSS